ncbi:MAG: NAD(P)H-dependent oxidoreductase subunit E [Planctomycetes bacterium]|nr:NAD(P)H-dependent oxidoreductase subunit E [Planctomycetota bacterium]
MGLFSIEEVACLGCCSLAPCAQIDQEIYGPIVSGTTKSILQEVKEGEGQVNAELPTLSHPIPEGSVEIRIALDSCCIAQGAKQVYESFLRIIHSDKLKVKLKSVACVGLSCKSPLVSVYQDNQESMIYGQVKAEDAKAILYRHSPPHIIKKFNFHISRAVDLLLNDRNWESIKNKELARGKEKSDHFLNPQVRIATEYSGESDPLNIHEYKERGGFVALEKCLKVLSQEEVLQEIKSSGLRGRGGGGFPTSIKWTLVKEQNSEEKYVICNGDEGDPGAFMDRMILESYPFRVIEGLAISAVTTGAKEGIFYIRAEYPLAVERINQALDICYQEGVLGDNVLGYDFKFNLKVFRGAGAFICGEETALIASIEGGRGTPRARPPYPAVQGLWKKPTLINNVETLANVPYIIRNGAAAFARYGTEESKGTKVFALAGKVKRGGLIEVPMGTTFKQIVNDIGGGIIDDRRFKAVQIGGPSGGCIPASLADTPIEYEGLKKLGAIMGSGGLVVLDDKDCMVEIARYFVQFTKEESCGQCSIGRLGTTRLYEMLTRLVEGKAKKKDIDELKRLGDMVQKGSLCGLCKTAPNPLLTTLKYFPEEYEAHINGRCPAGKCKDLIKYEIMDNCIGCTRCAQYCPTDAIPMVPFRKHEVIHDLCISCNKCYEVCPEDAVFIR